MGLFVGKKFFFGLRTFTVYTELVAEAIDIIKEKVKPLLC